jgi:peptide/nickel transport system permease protein
MMFQYTVRRTLMAVFLVLGAATVVFVLIHMVPGDVVVAMLGEMSTLTPEQIEAVRHRLGLDLPLHIQYFNWISSVVRGDLQESLVHGRPVMTDVLIRLPRTLELVVVSMALGLSLGIPTGTLAAIRRDSAPDFVLSVVGLMGLSLPSFVMGTLLILVLGLQLRWFPCSGFVSFGDDPVHHLRLLSMPAITLGLGIAAIIMRMTRGSLLEVLQEDYIRTARAKGLNETVVYLRHALKNALIPVVTTAGVSMGSLLGGTVIVESLFSWPGLSSILISAVEHRDYPMVQGVVLVVAGGFVFINLAVDLINAYLDPRIRYE